MSYRAGSLLGRLASGLEHDRGTLTHAVPCDGVRVPANNRLGYKFTYPSLCGRKPGPRSVGWAYDNNSQVTCPRCLKKLARTAA